MNTGLTQVLSDSTNTYLYGNGRIAQANSTTEYFLGDALGSVRQLADPTANVTLIQSYAPYGEVTQSVGSGATAYQFTGEMRDANGLVYLRARYYAPQDGRFLSRDTWGGVYSSPQSLNHWNYTESNPVNFTDPSGYWCVAGLSVGPGRDCSEEEIQRWKVFYISQAVNIANFMYNPQAKNDISAGFLYEYTEVLAMPIKAYIAWMKGCDMPSTSVQSNQLFAFGQYMARGILVQQGLLEMGVGVGGTLAGLSMDSTGVGILVGVPVSVISAAVAGHGAVVIATVAYRTLTAPLPPLHFSASGGGGGELRGKEATRIAVELGYTKRIPPQKSPFNSHGQSVFQNPKTRKYITPDVDSHSGGIWKMFSRNKIRIGTYNIDLTQKIGP